MPFFVLKNFSFSGFRLSAFNSLLSAKESKSIKPSLAPRVSLTCCSCLSGTVLLLSAILCSIASAFFSTASFSEITTSSLILFSSSSILLSAIPLSLRTYRLSKTFCSSTSIFLLSADSSSLFGFSAGSSPFFVFISKDGADSSLSCFLFFTSERISSIL